MASSPRKKILCVSSNRADIGIIAPVWNKLIASLHFDVSIFLTGTHVTDSSYAKNFIPDGTKTWIDGADISGTVGLDTQVRLSKIETAVARSLEEFIPDILLITGDRLDMFPAATASIPFNIPIAHIAGGDLSYGAIDDRLRHALTKLSHVHFVLNEHSARRVSQMGEEPDRIQIVGAPNLDTLLAIPRVSREDFARELGFQSLERLRLVTVHPETNNSNFQAPLDAVLTALEQHKDPTLITAPNADPGANEISKQIQIFCRQNPWAIYRENLGARLYANAMRMACTMIGNSSSGIIEAGLFGLNVINVGTRQEGRETGSNVHHANNDPVEICNLMAILDQPATNVPTNSLYGDGHASERILHVLRDLPDRASMLFKKFDESKRTNFIVPWS